MGCPWIFLVLLSREPLAYGTVFFTVPTASQTLTLRWHKTSMRVKALGGIYENNFVKTKIPCGKFEFDSKKHRFAALTVLLYYI